MSHQHQRCFCDVCLCRVSVCSDKGNQNVSTLPCVLDPAAISSQVADTDTNSSLHRRVCLCVSLLLLILPPSLPPSFSLSPLPDRAGRKVDEQETFSTSLVSKAKKIMMPFVLRRVKEQVLRQLPEKTTEIIHCDMSPYQQEQYHSLLDICKKAKATAKEADDDDGDDDKTSGDSTLAKSKASDCKFCRHMMPTNCAYVCACVCVRVCFCPCLCLLVFVPVSSPLSVSLPSPTSIRMRLG